ncbi:hypothetical protein K439DRAFT_1652024 [Ramaria rubella]|nr:hypothetical protein K439DRAFT_1652024 [Ramaria rubella]
MLHTPSKSVYRLLSTPIVARPIFRAFAVEALPASLRTNSHVAAAGRVNQRRHISSRLQSAEWSKNSPIVSRGFHASRRNEAWPLLLAGLKSSLVLTYLQTFIRVALTLVPIALVRRHHGTRWLRKLDRHPEKYPELEAKRPFLKRRIRIYNMLLKALFIAPAGAFALVVLVSLERTPLTGRIRIINLSPQEEEGIARDLAGAGWYDAVDSALTTSDGPPKFIPTTDWRYIWVERILRRLESVVPALQDDGLMRKLWLERYGGELPYPPPPCFPLIPRPRASQILHYFGPICSSQMPGHDHAISDTPPHSVLGPPYSLLVADQPGHSSAFSYGFGPNGSGGMVVFSGFLDEISQNTASEKRPKSTSLFSFLTRSFFSFSPPAPPAPTPEQEIQLAILVAHELAHLLLSHHLETLSSTTILLPNLTSIVTDVLRVVLFPITMVGGPFLNDALKQVGEVGQREFTMAADSCSSQLREIEADVVSIRLLALAGWDARAAVDFWQSKLNASADSDDQQESLQAQLPGTLPNAFDRASKNGGSKKSSHPLEEMRIKRLKKELERWETARSGALTETNPHVGSESLFWPE